MLTPTQWSMIVGTMLGDGAMRCKREALLEINHSAAQREYVDWKYEILRDLVSTPPHQRHGNGKRIAYRFTTRSLPALTPLYKAFYKNGRKGVPEIVLDGLSLAVWFMDDGSKSRNSVYFNTQQFSLKGQRRLIAILGWQYGIDCTLNKDKSYSRIRVATRSVGTLRSLIDPYLLQGLRYKLPI